MEAACKVLGAFVVFAFCFGPGAPRAQSYPAKPIKIVVGYSPGGGTDILARMVGQKLSEQMGRPVMVENRPGADAAIGAEYVAKAAPDGYTLFAGTTAEMVFNSALNSHLAYDPVKDFIPVIHLSMTPMIFAVNHAFPANSMRELVALARANPGRIFYSSGTAHFRVGAELFNKQAGTKIVHVPYKGSGPAVNAAVAGEVQIVVTSVASSMAQLRAGKLRALAATSSRRSVFLPDTPTLQEAGLDFEVGEGVPSWTGLFAPTGTSAPIIDKLFNEVSIALRSEAIRERFSVLGYESSTMSPPEFAAAHKAELAKWTKVVKDLGLRND